SIAVILDRLFDCPVGLVDPVTLNQPPAKYEGVDDNAYESINRTVIQPAAGDQNTAHDLQYLPDDRDDESDIHHLPFPKSMRKKPRIASQRVVEGCGAVASCTGL